MDILDVILKKRNIQFRVKLRRCLLRIARFAKCRMLHFPGIYISPTVTQDSRVPVGKILRPVL